MVAIVVGVFLLMCPFAIPLLTAGIVLGVPIFVCLAAILSIFCG